MAAPSLAVTTAGDPRTTICRVVIYLQRDMSGDSCLPQRHAHSDTHTSPPPLLACPKTKTCSYRGAVGLGNKYVRLNVGGNLFYTTLQVLTRENSLLKAMFSGKMEVFTDKEGELSLNCKNKLIAFLELYLKSMTRCYLSTTNTCEISILMVSKAEHSWLNSVYRNSF